MKLTLMTINLRYAGANDGEHVWENRRPIMAEMLREYHPDIFGVQEGMRPQLDDLIEALPGYAVFGEGRDGLDRSEHVAIFYNVHRVYCLEGHTFWFSETPEVPGSKSWESSLPRLATCGRFQVKSTGMPFYFLNTHFDHRSELARQQSAQLVWSRVRDRQEPTFLTGDFNCTEESFAWQYLTGSADLDDGEAGYFIDVWHAAEERKNPVSTYHGYRGPQEENIRIDWILMRPALRVLRAETVIYQKNGLYASDHFAVYAEVEMPDQL
jgi:endonuclease/exonuclease/phosphatase family metal-dependent hydrolase